MFCDRVLIRRQSRRGSVLFNERGCSTKELQRIRLQSKRGFVLWPGKKEKNPREILGPLAVKCLHTLVTNTSTLEDIALLLKGLGPALPDSTPLQTVALPGTPVPRITFHTQESSMFLQPHTSPSPCESDACEGCAARSSHQHATQLCLCQTS